MKKILATFVIIICSWHTHQASANLTTADAVQVKDGIVTNTTVISDFSGQVFLEFTANTRILNEEEKSLFTGSILPPDTIEAPDRPPRGRMRTLLSFQLLGSSNQPLLFSDKLEVTNFKNILRLEATNPEELERTPLVKVFAPLNADIKKASLWEYMEDKKSWIPLGGTIEESSDPEVNIFKGFIKKTGTFAIFDNDPAPEAIEPFPLDQIQPAEPDPFADAFTNPDNIINEAVLFDEEDFLSAAQTESFEPTGAEQEIIIEPSENTDQSNPLLPTESQTITSAEQNQALIGTDLSEEEIIPLENIGENEGVITGASVLQEATIPDGSILPRTGISEEETNRSTFPITILVTLLLLIASGIFAFRKEKHY